MPDTVRTRADLVTLLADNTVGAITAQIVRDWLASVAIISSGAGAPASAPASLFEFYFDTTNKVTYIATGTSAASDWKDFVALVRATAKQDVTATGSLNIDHNAGEAVNMSLTGDVTSFAVSNWPASGRLGRLVLNVNNTGAYNITAWPTGTKWPSGVAPTITSGAGKKDCIILHTYDGGTTIWGSIAGQDYS